MGHTSFGLLKGAEPCTPSSELCSNLISAALTGDPLRWTSPPPDPVHHSTGQATAGVLLQLEACSA